MASLSGALVRVHEAATTALMEEQATALEARIAALEARGVGGPVPPRRGMDVPPRLGVVPGQGTEMARPGPRTETAHGR